jgi:hypothetical protein
MEEIMALTDKTYQPVQQLTIEAAEDLPPFRFVSHLGSLCAADNKALGVTETDWLSGEKAAVVTLGTIPIATTTTVNIGDDITADTDGKGKTVTGSEKINGRALDGTTGAGFVRMKIVP